MVSGTLDVAIFCWDDTTRFKTWLDFRLRWQIPCSAVITLSNFSEIFIIDIPFARPLLWDVGCLLWIETLIYILFQPLYVYNIMLYWAALWLHSTIIWVGSDYTFAQINQGWRPIYVDIQISLTFRHLCSMPNLIYECYTASLLYRSKLYVIRTIFIIFHICAILPFPELNRNGLFSMLFIFCSDSSYLCLTFL